MEDTLGGSSRFLLVRISCLNPCFNGRYSRSLKKQFININAESLNPCSNGRCSRRGQNQVNPHKDLVLILVLMEDALGDTESHRRERTIEERVLILVLMEDALGEELKKLDLENCGICLNPCSNGRCSRRANF